VISFVIPAYNEADFIGPTLRAIRDSAAQLALDHEVIVADDASTDRTSAIAEALGARIVRCSNRQIAATRNAGAAVSKGEYLIFVDADTTVNTAVVGGAIRALDAGAVGGGADVRWEGRAALHWRLSVAMLFRFFRITRYAAGSFFFCRRDVFEAVGGFDETLYAAEEIWLSIAMKKRGRFVILKEHVHTSTRKLDDHSSWEIFRTAFSILLRGPRAVRKRKGLELWYEQRT